MYEKLTGGQVDVVEDVADELNPEYLNLTVRKRMRWVQLALCCTFVVANYYCYDIPATIETEIEEKFVKSPSEFGLLYTVYGIPNMILPLVGGILIDKIGVRRSRVLFSIITATG